MLLAADCVYDDGMTSALVALMSRVLPALGPSAVAFVSLERRVNFCLEGMCARAHMPSRQKLTRRSSETKATAEGPSAGSTRDISATSADVIPSS